MGTHVANLNIEQQQAWLQQRGWKRMDRGAVTLWKDPETGSCHLWQVAFAKAKEVCRLPADFELTPT